MFGLNRIAHTFIMEMGPPKLEGETSNSSIFHGSKSESNLFRSFTNGLNGATSLQSSLNGADQEQVLTSTFSTSDNNFQTPVRGTTLFPKNAARRFQRSSSHIGGNSTPSSGPRTNPFDSQLSMDRLHLPTCSPSVFSIVVSPSQVPFYANSMVPNCLIVLFNKRIGLTLSQFIFCITLKISHN